MRFRSALLVMVATAAVGAVAACTPPAPRGAFTVPPAPCADVVLITARGSSQEVASGETRSVQRRFREAVSSLAPRRSLRVLELGDLDRDAVTDPGGYPAYGFEQIVGLDPRADPDREPALIGGYNESRRVGSAELAAVLEQVTVTCPASRIVVVGTSMGADAVAQGLRLVSEATLERIDALHLFGDPRFTVGPWMRAPGAQIPSGHGLLGARVPYVPTPIAGRTVSWCGEFDGTCTGVWPLSIFQLIPDCSELRQYPWCSRRHIDYDHWAHEPAMEEAVLAVIERAGWPRPSPTGR